MPNRMRAVEPVDTLRPGGQFALKGYKLLFVSEAPARPTKPGKERDMKSRVVMCLLATMTSLATLCAGRAFAASYIVDPSGMGDFTTIQYCVDWLDAEECVLVPGVYHESVLVGYRALPLSIVGQNGSSATVIDADPADFGIAVTGNAWLLIRGVTITGAWGCGIIADAYADYLSVEDCRIVGNGMDFEDANHGGVLCAAPYCSIADSEITQNKGKGAVTFYSFGDFEGQGVINSRIYDNKCHAGFYGLLFGGGYRAMQVVGSAVYDNYGEGMFGVIYGVQYTVKCEGPPCPGSVGIAISTLTGSRASDPSLEQPLLSINAELAVDSSILWVPGNIVPIRLDGSYAQVNAIYSNIRGGYPGLGNFDADPKFQTNTYPMDVHLRAGSPCIDRSPLWTPQEHDFDGDPRIVDGNCDGSAVLDIG